VHARVGVDRILHIQHRLLRVVLDLNQLGGVLGGVPVVRDDHRQRFAHIAGDLVRSGQIGDAAVDAGRKGPRHRGHVRARQHADHSR
jgi:hypothetical protein